WRPPFLPSLLAAIFIAALYPNLGLTGGPLRPELTVNLFGVAVIFLISGLSLRLSQLATAATNFKSNLFIQCFSYALFPAAFLPLATALRGAVDSRLLTGVVVLSTLPISVNMCIMLTARAQGDLALAIFSAVLSNAAGVMITPALVFALLGKKMTLPLGAVLSKLSRRVVLPLAVGLALRRSVAVRRGFDRRRAYASLLSEAVLLGVVYSTAKGLSGLAGFGGAAASSPGFLASAALLLGLPFLYVAMAGVSWLLARRLVRLPADQAVAALYCSTHKTLAFGIPLIKTLFEGPDVSWITVPLLV
ncbi:unnamed protein product, partial [Phaeothamnion confervicola]